jgi:hypothetical protein
MTLIPVSAFDSFSDPTTERERHQSRLKHGHFFVVNVTLNGHVILEGTYEKQGMSLRAIPRGHLR